MHRTSRLAWGLLALAAVFCAGYVAGQNKFAQPKTIVHISLVQWKADAPEAEKQKALEGIKEMATQIPGIKNIWLKPLRMQPRDFHTAFVIEFEDRAAADRYATHPLHETWSQHFRSIRERSISPQVTN